MSLSRFLSSPVRQVGPTVAALTGSVNSGTTTGPASPAGATWMWGGQQRQGHVLGGDRRAQGAGVAVDDDGGGPGARAAPGPGGGRADLGRARQLDSERRRLGSASTPLSVMTAATALRATVMTAMVTSRLPI